MNTIRKMILEDAAYKIRLLANTVEHHAPAESMLLSSIAQRLEVKAQREVVEEIPHK